jgi:hypothetical protein
MRRPKKTGRRSMLWIGLAAAAAVGVYLYWRSRSGPSVTANVTVTLGLEPMSVTEGQAVSVDSYRLIKERRTGMTYAPATGALGGAVQFTAPKAGAFTRNLIQDSGGLAAEIA